uniref:Uncharacterized protein n=1 Tax=Panthera tigris altaica TaxID=74533 RepID=A0A8C9KNQ1_PANTA
MCPLFPNPVLIQVHLSYVPPVLYLCHYSVLFLGMAYRDKRYKEERRMAAEEREKKDEKKWNEGELAEAQDDSMLK